MALFFFPQSTVEVFDPSEGYGATVQAPAASRNWRGAAALKLAVFTLALVAVLAVAGVFTTSDQVLRSLSLKH